MWVEYKLIDLGKMPPDSSAYLSDNTILDNLKWETKQMGLFIWLTFVNSHQLSAATEIPNIGRQKWRGQAL